MEVRSIYRGARISAFKAREVTREIQGLPASAALDIVAFSPKKAAALVSKTLRSAIANAENNADLRVDRLVVKEATVGEGPTMRRFKSRARGSASTIRKRTSHIRIVLADDLEPSRREPKGTKTGRKPQGTPAKAADTKGLASTAAPAPAAAATPPTAEPAASEVTSSPEPTNEVAGEQK